MTQCKATLLCFVFCTQGLDETGTSDTEVCMKRKSLCISKIQRLLSSLLKKESSWMMTVGERECDISVGQLETEGQCGIPNYTSTARYI